MGAWGPGLFSDDLACDVRDGYREWLEDGASDEAALQHIVDAYADSEPETAVVWLALAVTQSKLGRLDRAVRDRALEVIDSGADLELWEDSGHLVKRRAVLQKVRAQLTGPQPARKTVRRPYRHVTDLVPGQALGYRASNDRWALLRVARIDHDRYSVAPIMVALDHDGQDLVHLPDIDTLADRAATPFKLDGSPMPPWSSTSWRVSTHRRIDHRAAGFQDVGATTARPGDASLATRTFCSWQLLSGEMEFNLTEPRPHTDNR
jgi:hypothetical protein